MHIAGKDNVIADTLSCLINIDPDIVFGTRVEGLRVWFHTASRPYLKLGDHLLQKKLASVDGVDVCEISITYDNDENLPNSVEMQLSNEKFFSVAGRR